MIIDNFTIDGTTVIPNPEEEATEELNKLQIEDTVYSVGSGGGGFTPSLLALYSTSEAQSDLTVEADMSGYTWLIIEFEKPNEMMSGYSGPFRKIVWIPTDSMGDGETGTTSDHTGVAYNQAIPTSLSVSDCSMISIKDAHTIHWVASGNYKVRRVWGI